MTVTVSAEIVGADRLAARLEAAKPAIDIAVGEAMTKAVFVVEAAVKARTPRVTGRLFSSINGDVRYGPALQGRVSTSVSYAPHVELGRGPLTAKHLTASGKPGYLKFRGQEGKPIYRRTVGPAAGRFMFREGWAMSKDAVTALFRDAVRQAVKVISKG